MTNEDKRRKELLKEAESLGIISIEGDPYISIGLLEDSIKIVKELNADINFNKLAKEAEEIAKKMGY